MSDDSKYYQRTILKEHVPSRLLPEGERPVRIFLPPGYNELVSYPIVYCADGEDFFNYGRAATTAVRLILDEGVEPFILVGIDVDKTKRTSEYAPEGDRHNAYLRFVKEELIPYVENRWHAQSEFRIAAGDSLGAAVSLHLALSSPNLFQRVLSLSGAFFGPTVEALKAAGNLSWLSMYMLVGTEETEVTTERGTFDFVAWNRKARDVLQGGGADLHYTEKPGRHVWGLWQQELPEALRLFLG